MLLVGALFAFLIATVWAARLVKLVAVGMERVVEQDHYDREFHRIVDRLGALDPEGD